MIELPIHNVDPHHKREEIECSHNCRLEINEKTHQMKIIVKDPSLFADFHTTGSIREHGFWNPHDKKWSYTICNQSVSICANYFHTGCLSCKGTSEPVGK